MTQSSSSDLDVAMDNTATEQPAELVWTPEMVVRFWDYEANFPERFFTYRNGAEVVRQLRAHFRDKATILDYGCGPGYLLGELLNSGIQAAGLDFSSEAMRKTSERFAGRANFLGTFTPDQLVESKRRFDAICVFEVIEHLYDAPLEKLLSDVERFLAPDGIALFTTPNEEDLAKSTLLCPVSGRVFHRWQHVRSWSRETLSSYLEAKGFTVIDCFETNFRGGLSKAKKKGAIGKQIAILKRAIAKRWGKKNTPHLVAIARPRAR